MLVKILSVWYNMNLETDEKRQNFLPLKTKKENQNALIAVRKRKFFLRQN